ncbi:MAG: beta-lactamase family protein, partial [Pseudomonadota bacterium]|nr:beta-lactamase family protein [Pseudomonadota bacterium]
MPVSAPLDPIAVQRMRARIDEEVSERRIPGASLLIARGADVVFEEAFGLLDPERALPMPGDALFRIYSMTKPIVSVVVMQLVERGRLLLSDPIGKYLPALATLQVARESLDADGVLQTVLQPCKRAITIQDLLRHTAGLTYGIFGTPSAVKAAYQASGIERSTVSNADLIAGLGRLPLAYQPGTVWEYSRATDVLGGLLETLFGATLDEVLQREIFTPLQMRDTGFWVEPAQQHRLAQPFARDPMTDKSVRLIDVTRRPTFLSGGGGLVSTARDYLRFARMLRNGGQLDGVRLLSRKSIALMTADHLAELPNGRNGPAYLPGPGYGFGLGLAVRTHLGGPVSPGSVGDFHWSGLAGTLFWIDPSEDLIAIWMVQAPEQRDRLHEL